MKRVLRSCVDPLPRFLSTRGLALLVLVLVAGTALSVHGFLQAEAAPMRAARPEARRQPEARPTRNSHPATTRFAGGSSTEALDHVAPAATATPSTTASRPSALSSPGAFEPAGS